MKSCLFVVLSFLCFLNCSNHGGGSETGANNALTVQTSSIVTNDNRNATGDALKTQPSNREKRGNFRVDEYVDKELVRAAFFRDGLLVRGIAYNTQTKRKESEVEYFYTKDGDFERLKITKGDPVLHDIFTQSAKDLEFQSELLKSKGIEFPLPDIVTDAVSDLSRIFSIADNYSDFKTDTRIDGNQKVIKFIDFNKKVGFERSVMTFRAGGIPILIKDYELTLENDSPTKESLKTDEGELIKTYSYKDGRLIGVVYQFTDLENQTNTLEKRFEYHELNQKP